MLREFRPLYTAAASLFGAEPDVEEMLVKIRGERIWLWRALDDGSADGRGSRVDGRPRGALEDST